MGLLDSLKNMLGLQQKLDVNNDGKLDADDLKSAASDFADTNDDGKIDISDIEGLPTALSELKDDAEELGGMTKKSR